MRILVIEDDPVLASGLVLILRRKNYSITHESNGKRADHLLLVEQFDLVILDMCLPDMDGTEILRRLRHRGEKVPVLVLTARDKIEERVQGLDFGADDYLIKPFNWHELEARIRALLRRGQSATSALLQFGDLCLDTAGRLATLHGETLKLSAREFNILEILMLRANRAVSMEQLNAQLSDMGEEISVNAVQVFIHRLRKKIWHGNINIRAQYGTGYILENRDSNDALATLQD